MAVFAGIKNRFAIQKAATWGTLLDASTSDLFPVNEDGATVDSVTERIANMELNDSPMQGIGDIGNEAVSGEINRYLHYRGDHYALAGVMGTAGVPPQIGTTGFYTHQLVPATSLEGIFYSLFSDMEVSTHAVDSAKLTGIQIQGKTGGYISIKYTFLGRNLDIADDLTWGSVTEHATAVRNFVIYSHGLFMVNAQGGAGLATTTDDIYPSEFTINFENNIEGFTTSEGDPVIQEPTRNGFLTCSGSFTIPAYSSNTNVSQILAQTALKAELRFILTAAESAFSFFLPYIIWTGAIPQPGGPGRQPLVLEWLAEQADSSPTNMDSTMPYMDIVNDDSADPLA